MSYPDEGATYAGALGDDFGLLKGVLVATDMGEALAERERGYQFTSLHIDDLMDDELLDDEHGIGAHGIDSSELNISPQDQIWICETLRVDAATAENPLPQSYVDTCMSGA